MPGLDDLTLYAEYLRGAAGQHLPEDLRQRLIGKGIVAALEEAASQGEDASAAYQLLYETAAAHPDSGIRSQAFLALTRLAQDGHNGAVDQIYRLAVENDLLAARQSIASRKWEPSRAELRALFDWFSCLASTAPFPGHHLSAITNAYFREASPGLQRRLLASASAVYMDHWALIVTALQDGSAAVMLRLVEAYPSFSNEERQLALDHLNQDAQQGSQLAQDILCRLFTTYNDQEAKRLVVANGYLPEDIEQQALLYFLAENWRAYSNLDFDHNLLTNVYESSDRPLRRRLMDHSRKTGQTEWLRGLGPAGEVRWPEDLTDADWELAVHRLAQARKYDDLWRLSQAAAPHWSATILVALEKAGWMPEGEDEQAGYANLASLARNCLQNPLAFRPKKALHSDAPDILCLAVHPAGRLLAAGSSDQRTRLWNLPDGDPAPQPLSSPVPVTRALAISPDGEMIACASGDHRIRAYHRNTGQIAKVFEGHRAMVRSLAIHPNGRLLFSAGFDSQIRFWRFPFGPELKVLQPGSGEIFSLALGNKGKTLASGGMDGVVRFWVVPDGSLAREISDHVGAVTHLAASASSELVASAGNDGKIFVWNSSSGGLVSAMENTYGPVTGLCLHPDDMVLISGHENGQINLWNISAGKVMHQLTGHRKAISGLAQPLDGSTLYSSDLSGSLFAWDLSTFLFTRLARRRSDPGLLTEILEKQRHPHLSAAEKTWLNFSAELARWNQRYEIELSDFEPVQVGEFDIELF